jgi:hypothetical protein
VRQATPLWRKSFLSQLQEEQQQAITQQSSRHDNMDHRPHPHAAAAVQSTGGHVHTYTQLNNQHQWKVQSAVKANRSKVNSNRNGNVKTWADSGALSADSSVDIEPSRASSAKLKGRLGHLVAAIAEAHTCSSSSSISMDRYSYDSKSGGLSHDIVHVPSNAWMPDDDDCMEVHTCSKCDKMYNNREALEHHQSICTL